MPFEPVFPYFVGCGVKNTGFCGQKRGFFEKAAYLWLFFSLFLLFIGTYYGQNTAADAKKYKIDSRYSYI